MKQAKMKNLLERDEVIIVWDGDTYAAMDWCEWNGSLYILCFSGDEPLVCTMDTQFVEEFSYDEVVEIFGDELIPAWKMADTFAVAEIGANQVFKRISCEDYFNHE